MILTKDDSLVLLDTKLLAGCLKTAHKTSELSGLFKVGTGKLPLSSLLALSKSDFAKFMNLKKPTDNKRKRGFVRKCYFKKSVILFFTKVIFFLK